MTAIALTIATSDSGGGAGIQADLKTFSALGVYGASVIAGLTAQNTRGVQGIYEVPVDFVAAQMDSIFTDIPINAVKLGMLPNAMVMESVAERLKHYNIDNIILDPVMLAASGDPLVPAEAFVTAKTSLFPLAKLITPNLPEAAALLGGKDASSEEEMLDQAKRLLEFGSEAVLIKGGHGEGSESVDLLVCSSSTKRFSAPRFDTHNDHGTGCTLSSAIASGLAKGLSLEKAVEMAKIYITEAIKASIELHVGGGHGPVHHFHAFWQM